MKQQTTKKLFALIIAIMMFSAIPQLACAQKDNPCPPGYKWKCGYIRPPYCRCVKTGNGKNSVAFVTSKQSIAANFELEYPPIASIKIYDATGQLVKTLADKIFEQGEHQLQWDAAGVNAGIYIVQFNTGTYSETKKIVVIK
jgi:hypothetical protein